MEPTNTVINEIYADVQKYLADKDYESALRACDTEAEYNAVFDAFIEDPDNKLNDDITRVREILPTFKIELQHMGFKEAKNPFISFVKFYVARHGMSLDNYNIIHNLYVEGIIQDADLSKRGPLKGSNVIFHDKLYRQNKQSIEYIIKLQDWIINNSGLKNKVNNKVILDHYNNFESGNDRLHFLIDVLYDAKDFEVVNITKDKKFKFHRKYDDGGKLFDEDVRSASEIEDIMLAVSKQAGEGDIDDDDREDRKSNWQDIINDLNINERNVRDVISTLVIAYVTDPEKAVTWIRDFGNEQSDPATTVRWRSRLAKTNIDEKNVANVISYLAKKYIPRVNGGNDNDNQSR